MEFLKKDFLDISRNVELALRKIELYSFESIDSTQSEARRHAENGKTAPALFVADTQTAGRGRLGRSFYSPSETGIYMTLLLDVTNDPPAGVCRLTSGAAVAVALAAEDVTGASCKIKWVNDIYVNGRKACGILAQSFFAHEKRYVAIGVGVNLCTSDFPDEISGVACSLTDSTGRGKRAELAVAIACRLFDVYSALCQGDVSYMNEYRGRSAVLGKHVTFTQNGITVEGTAVAVNDDGGLCVKLADGNTVTLNSGEITLRIKENGGFFDE